MIESWTLKHFKSVYEETTLSFAPLTVFAGENSSGKSTMLQSLLLTTQTVQNPVQARSVILNGHIVRLGEFDDVVSNSSESGDISVGFQIKAQQYFDSGLVESSSMFIGYPSNYSEPPLISCHYTFSAQGSEDETDVLQLQPRLERSSLKIVGKVEGRDFSEEVGLTRRKGSVASIAEQFKLESQRGIDSSLETLEYEIEKISNIKRAMRGYGFSPHSGKPAGASLHHFLPFRISLVYDAVEESANQLVASLLSVRGFDPLYRDYELQYNEMNDASDGVFYILIDIISGYLPQMSGLSSMKANRIQKAFAELTHKPTISALFQVLGLFPIEHRRVVTERIAARSEEIKRVAMGGARPEYRLTSTPLPRHLDYAVDFSQYFFSRQVKYLGPLRDEPKPVYPLSGSNDPKDVGFKGEYTAAVLDLYKNSQVTYIAPGWFEENAQELSTKRATLLEAVLEWLQYMGVVNNIRTNDRGKLGHELKVSTSDSNLHDLTHVGVGVSQVLPILVLSLLAGPGATLIFEQPELHLHPRVQTRLADFFVSMTMLNRQCVVETHSEYLINRLRYLSVVDRQDKISDSVILYFVEKVSGHSKYKSIKINEFGVIEDWPKGFFDESESTAAAIIKASIDKRKRAKKF